MATVQISHLMVVLSLCLYSILLVAVAILSLYSVHLLLVTAKEGGWYFSSLC